jgi:hypothetical protein
MVSLAQAKAVQDLEADGWVIVEPSNEHAAGGRVMMTSTIGGHARYILVMPNGQRSAQPPTASEIQDW